MSVVLSRLPPWSTGPEPFFGVNNICTRPFSASHTVTHPPKTENPCCVHSAPSPWATAENKERLHNHCDWLCISFGPTLLPVTQWWRSERPPAPLHSLPDEASASNKPTSLQHLLLIFCPPWGPRGNS